MKISFLSVLSVVCVAMSLAPAWAGPVGVQRTLPPDERGIALGMLQAEEGRISRQLPEPPKGPAMARYMDKRARLQDLIDRINSGQPVSPDEIDQALQATYW
jgi:hypothetical protein